MFRIVCDPSSGSIELYLTKIIRSGSQMFSVCLVGVRQRNFEPVVCVCVTDICRVLVGVWQRNFEPTVFKITLPNTDQAHDNNL